MKKPKKTQINRKLFHAHALGQWGIKMSIPNKAINKYTDCNHKIIFNGIFHRNRNIPNIQFSCCHVRLFVTPWITAHQAFLSITNSWVSLRFTSVESVMPSGISSSVVPFSSCPQSLPASESFPMSQLFPWGGQSIGVSALASVLPKKSQG